jgi:hypothetical protein
MGATLGPSLVAGFVALVVAVGTNVAGYFVQRSKLRHELRTEFMAERAIVQLLENAHWTQRSFAILRSHIGGFDDDELRKLLVRSGALRFVSTDGTEWWGLRSRNMHLLNKPVSPGPAVD